MLMCVVGVAAGCVAVLAGCDGSSAPLPTEYDWVFESLTVTEDDAVHIYKVSVGGEYDGMTVDTDMVKVSFNTGAFFLDFADGAERWGEWKAGAEHGGAHMIVYTYPNGDVCYGTCGITTEYDGTEYAQLYIVDGNKSYIFVAATE